MMICRLVLRTLRAFARWRDAMQGPMQLACSSLSALERLVRRRRRSLEEVDCLKRSFQGLGPKPLQLMRAQDELVVQGARGVRAARPAMCHAATPRMPGCRAAKKPACGHVLLQLHGNCESPRPRATARRGLVAGGPRVIASASLHFFPTFPPLQ